MSHPIMSNMEYIHHRKEKGGYEEDDEDDDDDESSFESRRQNDYSKWHNMLRRMSINIQRDEGTPDNEIRFGRNPTDPTDHERALMLNIPHYSSSNEDLLYEKIEDNTLPTVEEAITDHNITPKFRQQPSYFENPFDTDTSLKNGTLPSKSEDEKKLFHPLMKMATERKQHHGLSNAMRNDSGQSKVYKQINKIMKKV